MKTYIRAFVRFFIFFGIQTQLIHLIHNFSHNIRYDHDLGNTRYDLHLGTNVEIREQQQQVQQ